MRWTALDVLKRIEDIRVFKGYSKYKLAKDAGMPFSTVNNLYDRQTIPSVHNMLNLIYALGVTPEQFFNEGNSISSLANSTLTEEEILLLQKYRQMDAKDRHVVKRFMQKL